MSRDEIIEKAARVIHGEVVLAAQAREIDIQVHDTMPSIRFERGIARALADAGLLARHLPTRDEIAEALSVPDVHHPDYCDCGQPVCGGMCDVNGEDCFCAAERCPGLDQQIDAVLELLKGQDA